MDYPLLAIAPRGFTALIPSADYWQSVPLGILKLYARRTDVLRFYDREGNRWVLKRIAPRDALSPMQRILGWLGSSLTPVVAAVDFQPAGQYDIEELRADFRSAVEADDDILCQHHDKQQILTWLAEAPSIAKIFNLYGWITKASFRGKAAGARGR